MAWHPDIPDLPISKPKIIEKLEQMDRSYLDSLPPLEIDETIQAVAHAVALSYKKNKGSNFKECVEFVSIALSVTGSSLGGRLGTAMSASSDQIAESASRVVFPD